MRNILILFLFTSLTSANELKLPKDVISYLKKEITKEQAIESLRRTKSYYNLIDFEVLDNNYKNPQVRWNIHFGGQQEQTTRSNSKRSRRTPNLISEIEEILKSFKNGILTENAAILKLKELKFPYNVLSLKIKEDKIRWKITSISGLKNKNNISLSKVLADYKKDKVSKKFVLNYLKENKFIYNVLDLNKDEKNKLKWTIGLEENKRDIASSSITSIGKYSKKSKSLFSATASYGKVSITSNINNDLNLNFFKFGGLYHRKLSRDLTFTTGLNATRFTNIDYTGGREKINPSDIYPELSINLTKKYTKFSLGAGYSLLNYFVTNEDLFVVELKNTPVNRLNGTASYFYSEKLNLSLNTGYLIGTDESIDSGIDFSLSALYKIDNSGKYKIALSAYKSFLTLGTGTKDEGQGIASTFIYNF